MKLKSKLPINDHLEPDAFDKSIRKAFTVDDTIIGEYDVKGSLLSKGTVFVCKERLLCKKPKVSFEYKQVQSLKCEKKKVIISITNEKKEFELKCKSIEHATSVFNLIRELVHIHQSKKLESAELDEKNRKTQEEKLPKREETASPTIVEEEPKKGIVSQMLGKSLVEFETLFVENQDCKY